VFAAVDAAATSVGFPIRNMHTISETGHTGDVLACVHALAETIQTLDKMNRGKGVNHADFENGHARLDQATTLSHGG
jgi:endoglucanase